MARHEPNAVTKAAIEEAMSGAELETLNLDSLDRLDNEVSYSSLLLEGANTAVINELLAGKDIDFSQLELTNHPPRPPRPPVTTPGRQIEIEYHPDGKISEFGYYPDGTVCYTREYSKGHSNGEFRHFHENGNVHIFFRFSNHKIQGYTEEFYPDGSVESIIGYKDNVIDGVRLNFRENHRLASFSEYRNGLICGRMLKYDENGIPQKFRYFSNPSLSGFSGIRTLYSANDKIKAQFRLENGELNGPVKVYDEEGKLISYTQYKNDMLSGVHIQMKDGRVNLSSHYKDGRHEGLLEAWNADGSQTVLQEYKGDMLHGRNIHWNALGEKTINERFEDGQKVDSRPLNEKVVSRPAFDSIEEELSYLTHRRIMDHSYDRDMNKLIKEENIMKEDSMQTKAQEPKLPETINSYEEYKQLSGQILSNQANKDTYRWELASQYNFRKDSSLSEKYFSSVKEICKEDVCHCYNKGNLKTALRHFAHVEALERYDRDVELAKQRSIDITSKETKDTIIKTYQDKQRDLLVNALESSLTKDGVWLNAVGKRYPMLWPKGVQVNGFNAAVLAMHSDATASRSNLYTSYLTSKNSGSAVKVGALSAPFLFYHWEKYQHKTDPEKFITREEYKKLPQEEKFLYKGLKQREVRVLYNVDQTLMDLSEEELNVAQADLYGVAPIENDQQLRSTMKGLLEKYNDNLVSVRKDATGVPHYETDKDVVYMSAQKSFGTYEEYAQEAFRQVASATGHEQRNSREGMVLKHGKAPSEDAVKYERLMVEIVSGLKMVELGLPAKLSPASQELVPYWVREIKENPKMMEILESEVNRATYMISRAENGEKIKKNPVKTKEEVVQYDPRHYDILDEIKGQVTLEGKTFVLVKDKERKVADVILPSGASLEMGDEVPKMRKDFISSALKKEGYETIHYFNVDGALGFKEDDRYFTGKEVSAAKLKNRAIETLGVLDTAEMINAAEDKQYDDWRVVKEENLENPKESKYLLYLAPRGEAPFALEMEPEDRNRFFTLIKQRKSPELESLKKELAAKYYAKAQHDPKAKTNPFAVDKNDEYATQIEMANIFQSKQNGTFLCAATLKGGEKVVREIKESTYKNFMAAPNKSEYKKVLAARIFKEEIKKKINRPSEFPKKAKGKETLSSLIKSAGAEPAKVQNDLAAELKKAENKSQPDSKIALAAVPVLFLGLPQIEGNSNDNRYAEFNSMHINGEYDKMLGVLEEENAEIDLEKINLRDVQVNVIRDITEDNLVAANDRFVVVHADFEDGYYFPFVKLTPAEVLRAVELQGWQDYESLEPGVAEVLDKHKPGAATIVDNIQAFVRDANEATLQQTPEETPSEEQAKAEAQTKEVQSKGGLGR